MYAKRYNIKWFLVTHFFRSQSRYSTAICSRLKMQKIVSYICFILRSVVHTSQSKVTKSLTVVINGSISFYQYLPIIIRLEDVSSITTRKAVSYHVWNEKGRQVRITLLTCTKLMNGIINFWNYLHGNLEMYDISTEGEKLHYNKIYAI